VILKNNPTEISSSESSLWQAEYETAGIPSSVRNQPSSIVRDFIQLVELKNKCERSLDIGCGSGRNTKFLAESGYESYGVDFESKQIERLNSDPNKNDKCHFSVADIRKPWAFPDNYFSLAIDTYCFKHLITNEDIQNYNDELSRVMSPDSYYLIFFATKNDSYYKKFPVDVDSSLGLVIQDPGNQIYSKLYDIEEIIALFENFECVHSGIKKAENSMHGSLYQRESGFICFKRK
jgi:SAM-dependent methyltransferase